MLPALHNSEWFRASEGRPSECLFVKLRVYEQDVVRQALSLARPERGPSLSEATSH